MCCSERRLITLLTDQTPKPLKGEATIIIEAAAAAAAAPHLTDNNEAVQGAAATASPSGRNKLMMVRAMQKQTGINACAIKPDRGTFHYPSTRPPSHSPPSASKIPLKAQNNTENIQIALGIVGIIVLHRYCFFFLLFFPPKSQISNR